MLGDLIEEQMMDACANCYVILIDFFSELSKIKQAKFFQKKEKDFFKKNKHKYSKGKDCGILLIKKGICLLSYCHHVWIMVCDEPFCYLICSLPALHCSLAPLHLVMPYFHAC